MKLLGDQSLLTGYTPFLVPWYYNAMNVDQVAECLNAGGVVVLRTDTLYGILAKASDQKAVERVYQIKGRQFTKPCIVLVASISDIPFDPTVLQAVYQESQGTPTSVVVPVTTEPAWVTRGSNTIAYRVPEHKTLKLLLQKTGGLIAPSANPEGLVPAKNIKEAKAYFKDQIDFYIDGGEVPRETLPSKLLLIRRNGRSERLR